jgi:hypothetical protein
MFQPIVPLSGYTGWRFLERTLEAQQETFNQGEQITRATDYFREEIGSISTAKELVDDRRLLEVALGAFGLDEDINNKYFIQKVLEDGTLDDDALANRLADSRYQAFSEAFGFGNFDVPRTALSDFPDEIITGYETGQFEVAVGDLDTDLRLALSLEGSLADINSGTSSDTTRWYTMMGNAPLREVFETALNLPSTFSQIDLDKQLEIFKERADSQFGSDQMADFADPERQEDLIRLFLIRSEAANLQGTSSGSIALTLLQS